MMATNLDWLVEQALDLRRRLAEQGATEDARVIEQLVAALAASRPQAPRPDYTVAEAAKLRGVSGQTIKNWANRGIIRAYRLGGRIVIPRDEFDNYRSLAEVSPGSEPQSANEEIVEQGRASRRPFAWPLAPREEGE